MTPTYCVNASYRQLEPCGADILSHSLRSYRLDRERALLPMPLGARYPARTGELDFARLIVSYHPISPGQDSLPTS